jgi:cytochrome c553
MVRRTVSVIFAIVIALQLSWVAVSAYCAHETGRAAQHFGHHQHVEDGDELPVSLKDTPSVVKKFAVHAHCSFCHHATLATTSYQPPIQVEQVRVVPSTIVVPLLSIYISPPERPQWTAAV